MELDWIHYFMEEYLLLVPVLLALGNSRSKTEDSTSCHGDQKSCHFINFISHDFKSSNLSITLLNIIKNIS